MKQYVIDELRPTEHKKINAYLDKKLGSPALNGIYWMPLEPSYYNEVQAEHTPCQPFYIAIELEPNKIICELLIRTKSRVRCNCISYATERQRNWIIDIVDAIFDELGIKT